MVMFWRHSQPAWPGLKAQRKEPHLQPSKRLSVRLCVPWKTMVFNRFRLWLKALGQVVNPQYEHSSLLD
jgi:hypothetical protein